MSKVDEKQRYEERIEELERENASLKKEVAVLKRAQKRSRDSSPKDTRKSSKKEGEDRGYTDKSRD